MSIIRTAAYTLTGTLCGLALLAAYFNTKYTEPQRLNTYVYQVETPQGTILVNDARAENMWLISFDDCQLAFTATAVAKVNGVKSMVEFRQELGETLVLTILRDLTNLKTFSMDVPCLEGVRTIDLKFREHWTETP